MAEEKAPPLPVFWCELGAAPLGAACAVEETELQLPTLQSTPDIAVETLLPPSESSTTGSAVGVL